MMKDSRDQDTFGEYFAHRTDPQEVREKLDSNFDSSEADLNDPKEDRVEEVYGATVNRNSADDPKSIAEDNLVPDGGYEFEQMEVYSEGEVIGEDVAAQSSEYDGVEVYEFGDEGIAIAGDRGEVARFVGEIRQQLGAAMDEHFFNERLHSSVPEPENGVMSRYETGSVKMSDVDHAGPDQNFGGDSTEVVTDGGFSAVPGTSLGESTEETDYSGPDREGRMGM